MTEQMDQLLMGELLMLVIFKWIDISYWGYKISENVGWIINYDDPIDAVLTGWKGSPGHWANIIDPSSF